MTIHEFLYIVACRANSISKSEIDLIAEQIYDMNEIDMGKYIFINWIRWDIIDIQAFLNDYHENRLYHFVNQTDEKEYIITEIDRLFDKQAPSYTRYMPHYRSIIFTQIPDELKT